MKSIKLILLTCVFVILFKLCRIATDGFALVNILPQKKPTQLIAEVEPPREILKKSLQQSFYYLGKGAQTYVFLSEDQKYVIKFFRQDRIQWIQMLSHLPFPTLFKNRQLATLKKRECKLERNISSYKLAFEELAEETGILYLHPYLSQNIGLKLTLFDKIGIKHEVQLDRMQFVLQKKADLFYPTMKKWAENKNHLLVNKGLAQLIELITKRCQKGIFDKDPDLNTNFGFVGDKLIQIDPGRYKIDPTRKNAETLQDELRHVIEPCKQWLETQMVLEDSQLLF